MASRVWKGRLAYRLTAVTVYTRGHNHTFFLSLPIDPDGKVRIDSDTYKYLIRKATNNRRGQTVCLGGFPK
jgi:hypothetical protein